MSPAALSVIQGLTWVGLGVILICLTGAWIKYFSEKQND